MNAKNPLDDFFRPSSIAVVGASAQRGSARNTLLRVLLRHGFEGAVYPVSPSNREIEGLAAYRSITDLPAAPDLALVITPAQTVPGIIAECGRKGIRNAIVYSAGFEEVDSGKDLARRLSETAREHGVAVLGANCQGLWSVRGRAVLSFSATCMALERLEHAPVAVISQSGALSGAIGSSLQKTGTGCSYIVSVGNETCLDALDFLAWIIEQDDVRVVGLYIEGLDDAHRLLGIAARARERGAQIVALKAGRSAVGQMATASHTGKIASAHAVYADVFSQAGVIAVDSLADLLMSLEVLAYLRDPRVGDDPAGGVSVLSSSGGAGALLADHSSELGIPLATFHPATVERLNGILPEFARKENPVDLTGQIYSSPNLFSDTCVALRDDPRTEAIVIQFAGSGRRNLEDNAEVFRAVAAELPVVASFVADDGEPAIRRRMRQAGVLFSADPATTMKALSLLYQRHRMAALPAARQRGPAPMRPAPRGWADAMRYCEECGIPSPRSALLGPGELASQACADLRYPVVVKALPDDAEHKTEHGLVRLRVASPADVDAHAADFRRRLGRPGIPVLAQEMVEGGVEVVLSCLRRTDFGPIVSIGTGGVAIELYRDVAHLALPVSADQVHAALRGLKLHTLLRGFRGNPPADVDALVRGAVRFGDLFLASPDVVEFELNPIIVKPHGQGIVVVDALVSTDGDRGAESLR